MPAYVSEPVVVLPPHKITTAEICEDVRNHHPRHPRLPRILEVIEGCGVEERYFTRPLVEAGSATGVEHRVNTAYADASAMATDAARRALERSGLAATDVDAVVTSHTTSFAVPNLDVHLLADLELRPDVSRIHLGTLACAGGAQALIRATDLVRAHPEATVLVVVSEVPSTIYHQDEDSMESMIYRALFGDSAGACLVTGTVREPGGLAVEDTFEYVLPHSQDRYWGHMDAAGIHFLSTKKALTAPEEAMPHLKEWLDGRLPDFAVIHPGGPRIVTGAAEALGLRPEDAHHSLDSLREHGNLSGNAVLDVLRRTHTDPPAPGAEGVMAAFGPGFTVACLQGRWH